MTEYIQFTIVRKLSNTGAPWFQRSQRLQKNEDKGEIITLLDGEDDFSDGKHALINTKYGVEEYLFTTVSYITRIQEHRSNLCAVLPCARSKDCQEPRPNCHHFGGELKGGQYMIMYVHVHACIWYYAVGKGVLCYREHTDYKP